MTAPTNGPLHDDDPRLTAYALGELPPDERAAVESYLRDHDGARRFVEETRAAAAQLEREFAALPDAGSLEPTQRAAVLAHVASMPTASVLATSAPRAKGRVLRLTNWPSGIAAAAAAIVVGVTFTQRDAIGRWWTGEERDVASARRDGWKRAHDEMDLERQRDSRTAELSLGRDAQRASEDRAAAAEAVHKPAADPTGTTARYGDDASNPSVLPGLQSPKIPAPTPPAKPSGFAAAIEKPEGRSGVGYDGAGSGGDVPGAELDRYRATGAGGAVERLGDGGAPRDRVTRRDPLVDPRRSLPGAKPSSVYGGIAGPGGGGGGDSILLRSSGGFALDGVRRIWLPEPAAGEGLRVQLGRLADDGTTRIETASVLTVLSADGKLSQTVQLGDTPILGYLFQQADIGRVQLDADVRRVVETRLREAAGGKDSPENYAEIRDNDFTKVADAPLSTFGTDVDTASYSIVRNHLTGGRLPPPGAVRIEEFLNYFPYQYAPPSDGEAFAVHADVAGCPWNTANRLVRIALKGREVDFANRPAANLVFLIDVSGSMRPENKLPLLLRSMKLLVEKLDEGDKVSIVVYAGASGLALAPTTGDRRADILAALDRLQAGGSTNGAAGIELAYQTAAAEFIPGGINRVILATDGDFNVGISDESSLVRLIEEKAKSKVFLSVLAFGEGNLQDAKMEKLADKGNGNYAYVDTIDEGEKVLVDQAAGTLMTIAKDVKVQVEFNPLRVAGYRLIGYENRVLAAQDFADDRKDAGDVGAGTSVTALYEIVPAGTVTAPATEPLRYQTPPAPSPTASSNELLTVKLRWKLPEGDVSTLRERPVTDTGASYAASSPDFKFAASVASFGMLLRNSPHKGTATFDAVLELATEGLSFDPKGRRAEFVNLVRAAKQLSAGR